LVLCSYNTPQNSCQIKSIKSIYGFYLLFRVLILTNQYGRPEKSGQPALWSVNKTTLCALKATPAREKHEAHSETAETVKACCGMQRFMLNGLGKNGAEREGEREKG
jgi:hypothetical protein